MRALAPSQILDNVMHGRHWSDDVGSAALFGAATGGLGGAVGAVGGRVISRIARGGKCSFSAETPVATPDGAQAIGSLQVGDQVEAYDPQTGATSAQTVEHVWINHDDDLIDLTLQNTGDSLVQPNTILTKPQETEAASYGLRLPQAAVIQTSSTDKPETIHTTSKHPWLTVDRGWAPAGDLHPGEQVVRQDGSTATITAVRVMAGAATMYNLTVSQIHTFVVGEGQYVVHNVCPVYKPIKHATRHLDEVGIPGFNRSTTIAQRKAFLEGGARSQVRVPYNLSGSKAMAHLVHAPGYRRKIAVIFHVDADPGGKWEAGQVATSFYPNRGQ